MHLYFITRGIKHQRDIFVNFMQAQMFPWHRKNLDTGAVENPMVQGSLRPVELWEYVFPEESLADVLTALEVNDDPNGASRLGSHQLKIKILRKMLGAKEIPKCEPEVKRFIAKQGVSIHPIGIKYDEKKDMTFPDGTRFHQEAL